MRVIIDLTVEGPAALSRWLKEAGELVDQNAGMLSRPQRGFELASSTGQRGSLTVIANDVDGVLQINRGRRPESTA